jgi:hypothetical protein
MHKIDKNIEMARKRLEDLEKVLNALNKAWNIVDSVREVDEDLMALLEHIKKGIDKGLEWAEDTSIGLDMSKRSLEDDREYCVKRALEDLEWDEIYIEKYEKL